MVTEDLNGTREVRRRLVKEVHYSLTVICYTVFTTD
jgi:hypothetical protein